MVQTRVGPIIGSAIGIGRYWASSALLAIGINICCLLSMEMPARKEEVASVGVFHHC